MKRRSTILFILPTLLVSSTHEAAFYIKLIATMSQIYRTAPTLMVGSLIVGTLFALGHHLFYASLDRKHAPTSVEGYDVLGTHVSIQQFNFAVGTAFAFFVRACLMLSISIAYFQILMWSVGKQGTKGTKLVALDVLTSALQDLVSLASFRSWRGRPWLWVLAVVTWLIPIASIITPATLSVGIDVPPSIYMNVPNVEFSSLNLAAPMVEYNSSVPKISDDPPFTYKYAGPSRTVQRITDTVAAQGFILPVTAPSVNSTWDLDFNGPSLHCNPVSSGFRTAVLANILNATTNCSHGPGYIAWHPEMMAFNESMADLPFIIGRPGLNNDNSHLSSHNDIASIFLAIAPTLFSSTSAENKYSPTICRGKPWYQAGLAEYYNSSTVLRCDVHNSTYQTTFSFVNGLQKVDFNNVTDVTHTQMMTLGRVGAYFNSLNKTDMSLRPQACPDTGVSIADSDSNNCVFDPLVLSTLSYQAVMHAFTDLVIGMISLGIGPIDQENLPTLITSTTQLSKTVLIEAPELAFLQSTETQIHDTSPSVQQRAAIWKQQPFTGLVNAAAATNSKLPFQQALEQLFRNITISLMSAPDLQPNTSSVHFPSKTEVKLTTRETVYIYAAYKLWLAYGLAVGVTALIASFGLAAMIVNNASFSNSFSTALRLSRGAQLSHEINDTDLWGQDPLPPYAQKATVRFSQKQISSKKDENAYTLIDRTE